LGEVVWKDASTADSQTTKLARNGSATRSPLTSTETSLLTKALLAKTLLAKPLLAEALLAEAALAEPRLSKAGVSETGASESSISKTGTAETGISKTGPAKTRAAELCTCRLVNSGTKCECRRHGCNHQTRARSKSHNVHSGWLENPSEYFSEYYGPARYRRAIDEPMVFVSILPTSLGLSSVGITTLHPLRLASDCDP
jgi:hypothetical protein